LAKMKHHILETSSKSGQGPSSIAPEFLPLSAGEKRQSSSPKEQKIIASDEPDIVNSEGEGEEDEWEDGYSHLREKSLSPNHRGAVSQTRARDDSEEGEDSQWMIPENTDDIDAETLASLPPTLRKHVIEQARYQRWYLSSLLSLVHVLFLSFLRKKESRKNRAHYLPVAEDPLLYSKTQLANFLRTRSLISLFLFSLRLSISLYLPLLLSTDLSLYLSLSTSLSDQ
jgi:hypothetical protein